MKKVMGLSLALAMLGGLLSGALTASASATDSRPVATEIQSFMFMDGKWTGSVAADRRLCVDHAKVTIYKLVKGGKEKVGTVELNTNNWANTGFGSFSFRPPAMDIKNRKKRLQALRGTYLLKLPEAVVSIYAKSFTCAEATNKVVAAV